MPPVCYKAFPLLITHFWTWSKHCSRQHYECIKAHTCNTWAFARSYQEHHSRRLVCAPIWACAVCTLCASTIGASYLHMSANCVRHYACRSMPMPFKPLRPLRPLRQNLWPFTPFRPLMVTQKIQAIQAIAGYSGRFTTSMA